MSESNGNKADRLDRIEHALDFLAEEQEKFLTSIQRLETLHEQTEEALRRAIRLGTLEMRRERVRRHEVEEKFNILLDAQIGYEDHANKRTTALLKQDLVEIARPKAGRKRQTNKTASKARKRTKGSARIIG